MSVSKNHFMVLHEQRTNYTALWKHVRYVHLHERLSSWSSNNN